MTDLPQWALERADDVWTALANNEAHGREAETLLFARALVETREEQWQSLDTAPKDGTEFQAWMRRSDDREGFWEPRCRINPESECVEIWGHVGYGEEDWAVYSHLHPVAWAPHPTPTAALRKLMEQYNGR